MFSDKNSFMARYVSSVRLSAVCNGCIVAKQKILKEIFYTNN